MEFYIFDMNFNRLGIVDVFTDSEFQYKYDNHSLSFLTIDSTAKNAELLINNEEDIILTKSDDIKRGFLIQSSKYEDKSKSKISISCASLSVILNWRLIEEQKVYSGNVEDVIRSFVTNNAITPANPNRVIPNLVLGDKFGIDIETDETYSYTELDVALWEICKKHDISYEILMDHESKKYVFRIFQGLDRTTNQTINSRVIFSKEFDNIESQSYSDDTSGYKTTAYVRNDNQGEFDDEPVLVKVGDEKSGFNRKEIFVNASDIKRWFEDEEGFEIELTIAEYENLLKEKGLNTLSEYQRVRTFENSINPNSQYIYGKHYNLGDMVTSANNEIGVIMHSRVVKATEKYTRSGYSLKVDFGTSVPTLVDKLKRGLKK